MPELRSAEFALWRTISSPFGPAGRPKIRPPTRTIRDRGASRWIESPMASTAPRTKGWHRGHSAV